MKKFLIKSSIVFLFCLLFFRFTIISLVNDYETKLTTHLSSSNIQELKVDIFNEIKKANKKDKILHQDDAEILGYFLKKVFAELNFRQ